MPLRALMSGPVPNLQEANTLPLFLSYSLLKSIFHLVAIDPVCVCVGGACGCLSKALKCQVSLYLSSASLRHDVSSPSLAW